MIPWRIAARLSALIAAGFLFAGCAVQPEDRAWSTGGALNGESDGVARIQFAQASSDDADTLFGVSEDEDDGNDPLEVPNRFIFAFNQGLDVILIKPVASGYRFLLPQAVRDSIRNVLRNLATPVVLINDLLQGEFERAQTTLGRFAINTSGGVLGLFDVAADEGLEYHVEDFGQTLGSYGVGEGAYLVLPIFGPSSIRDGTGRVVDIFLDPFTYLAWEKDLETENFVRSLVNGIDIRSRNIETLEDLERDSIDFYARVRSLWRQNRQNEIDNSRRATPSESPGISALDSDFELEDDEELTGAQ